MYLVDWNLNICKECGEINTLILYRGSEKNSDEPDRLICSKCGHEYAIDLDNKVRQFAPLIEPKKLQDFITQFTSGAQ